MSLTILILFVAFQHFLRESLQEVHNLQSKGYELVFVECQLSLGMLPMLAILHCWLTRKKNNSIEEKKIRF